MELTSITLQSGSLLENKTKNKKRAFNKLLFLRLAFLRHVQKEQPICNVSAYRQMPLEVSAKSTILCESSIGILHFGGARIPLFSGCNIVLGEIDLVNLIEDWDVLEYYAGEKLIFLRRQGCCFCVVCRV